MPNNTVIDRFHCDNMVIRDELGRQRLFRGINVCVKNDKFKTKKALPKILEDKYFDVLENNGVNIIRLGLTWELIEPKENQFSSEIIDVYKQFVRKCRDHGIYVFLDMHQDLFSVYCCKPQGDGAPKWALPDDIKSKRPFAIWAEGYFYMDSVQKSFHYFWNNKNNIQEKYVQAWQHFAKEFEPFDNVIGYDYLNEPFVDKNGRKIFLNLVENVLNISLGKDLNLENNFKNCSDKAGFLKSVFQIVSTVGNFKNLKTVKEVMDSKENFAKAVRNFEKYTSDFNAKYYKPFFDKMSNHVNTYGKFNFFEHNYYSNLGIPFDIECNEKSIYSPHAYDIFVDSPLYNRYASNARVEHIIDIIRANQLKMNVPVIFGEWGGGAFGTEWVKHINFIMNRFEKYQWSNIYWGFNEKKKEFLKVFNRPYPVAVNGNIIKIETNSKNRIFNLIWQQDNLDSKTLVYIPDKGVVDYNGTIGENYIKIHY